jgi:cyclic pyranopterin monophosphate synthase
MAGRRKSAATTAGLTHLNAANQPAMVDVGGKAASHRVAVAEARVRLPAAVATALRRTGHRSHKGPVFDTAIIAGVQAAKRTAELIPFCHPLPLDRCDITIRPGTGGLLAVRCQVESHHRTGVEMEALTGATLAALTIYDMCKALSHDIVIERVRLLAKRGGKRDFARGKRRARR